MACVGCSISRLRAVKRLPSSRFNPFQARIPSQVREAPAVWDRLLYKLQEATIHFLNTLIQAGADVVQLFDSWAGALDQAEYTAWAQTHHEAIWKEVTGIERPATDIDRPGSP